MSTPPFFYQELFELGADESKYRLLSKEGVSLANFEGSQILKVEPSVLEYVARQALHDCSFMLR